MENKIQWNTLDYFVVGQLETTKPSKLCLRIDPLLLVNEVVYIVRQFGGISSPSPPPPPAQVTHKKRLP